MLENTISTLRDLVLDNQRVSQQFTCAESNYFVANLLFDWSEHVVKFVFFLLGGELWSGVEKQGGTIEWQVARLADWRVQQAARGGGCRRAQARAHRSLEGQLAHVMLLLLVQDWKQPVDRLEMLWEQTHHRRAAADQQGHRRFERFFCFIWFAKFRAEIKALRGFVCF